MGALGLHLGHTGGPADGDALLHDVWDILADRMSRPAGLCTIEMYACYHWASLTVLDRWPARL